MAKSCAAGTTVIDITPYKQQILDGHNSRRNELAGGNIPNHDSAIRMGTVEWDDELALLATYNVKTCVFAHDQCRNTKTFIFSGQNLAMNMWYGGKPTIAGMLEGQMKAWFEEHVDSKMDYINSYPKSTPGVIGHFTAMSHELAVKVGCGMIKTTEVRNGITWDKILTACNYAHTNILNYKIYRSGPAASACTTGRNPKYPNLCSAKEVFNSNKPLA